jgi:hypothetical protein
MQYRRLRSTLWHTPSERRDGHHDRLNHRESQAWRTISDRRHSRLKAHERRNFAVAVLDLTNAGLELAADVFAVLREAPAHSRLSASTCDPNNTGEHFRRMRLFSVSDARGFCRV